MKSEQIVVGLGEILWDMLPQGKELGGAPMNFTYHAGALGARAYMVSAVGEDALGREILEELDQRGLSREFVMTDSTHPTGTVGVDLDAAGVPHYTIHRPVAWDFIRSSEALVGLAKKTDAVCFGSLASRMEVSRRSCLAFLKATSGDCLRVYDFNFRPTVDTAVVPEFLKLANVLKLNHEELPVLAGLLNLNGTQEEWVSRLLNAFELKMIALTCGGQGSWLYTAAEKDFCAVEPVKIADTVGAGDTFTAAMVMGMLHGEKLSVLHKKASRLAGYVCTQKGGTPAITQEYRWIAES